MSNTILRDSDKMETKQGYKKTKLGWIPEDWEIMRLDEIGHFKNGINKSKEDFGFGYPFINLNDVFTPNLNIKNLSLVNASKKELKQYSLTKGDVLFVRSSVKSKNVGITKVITTSLPDTIYSGFIIRFRTNEYLTTVFKNHCFDEDHFRHRLKSKSTISANTNVNQVALSSMLLIVPIRDEQKRIGKLLSTWDTAINKLDGLLQAKQQLKKALMQQLLNGKTRLPGFDKKWEERRLDYFFKERSERNNEELPLLSIGEAGVYPQDDSNKKDTSNKDKSKYKRICVGDIGYNTMRMWQGRSALSNLEGIVSPAYTIVKPKKNTDSRFFSYLFKTPAIIHRFYRNSQGMVSDTLNCKFKDFAPIKLVLPTSREEQSAIAEVLNTADQEIQLLQTQREQLQVQKKGLMQQLLTGKKRLKVN